MPRNSELHSQYVADPEHEVLGIYIDEASEETIEGGNLSEV